MNKYNNHTSIRIDPQIKNWLYTKMQVENRSLGNLINTILKREKEKEERVKNFEANMKELGNYLDTK